MSLTATFPERAPQRAERELPAARHLGGHGRDLSRGRAAGKPIDRRRHAGWWKDSAIPCRPELVRPDAVPFRPAGRRSPMHWSRLIDLPIAAPHPPRLRLGHRRPLAERFAATVWPAGFTARFPRPASVRLARELAGDAAARLALAFRSADGAGACNISAPARSIITTCMLVLLLWSLALLVRDGNRDTGRRLRRARCAALSMAIGLRNWRRPSPARRPW